MDPRTVLLVSSGWAIASAVGVFALGAASLAGGRSRRRGALPFGLFAATWGAHIVLANTASIVLETGTARVLHLVSLAFLLPAPYFLVELAASQDPSTGRGRVWTGLRVGAVGAALGAAASLVLAPDLVFEGIVDAGYYLAPTWGPVRQYLVVIPLFVGFGVALLAFRRAKRGSPTPRTARRSAILLAGLGLYLGYNTANNLPFFVKGVAAAPSPDLVVLATLFAALLALVVGIAVSELRAARAAPTPGEARRDRLVAAALLVPAAWGAVEAGIAMTLFPALHTVGLWRLLGVGVIAYGFARWRVFDLPDRARRGAATGAGAAAAGAGGAAVYAGTGLLVSGTAVPVAVGALAAVGALLPGVRSAQRLLGSPAQASLEDRVYEQRIDSYRAAVEDAMARGMPDEDEAFLAGLRDRYDITPEEDRVVRHYARKAVVGVSADGDEGSYDRLRLLGEGGEGRTWLARDRVRDRLVVLKEPLAGPLDDPDLRDRVLQEARSARKVRHPNVVEVEEIVEDGDSPVLVMEHVEGGSLADLLEAEGPLDWERARPVLLDVLAGLEAVHRAGLVHRDVKPSNVLLTADGDAKVADFGIATRRPGAPGGETLRDPEAAAGTRGYAAPEVAAGEAADEAADVYGAAALLHACLNGRPPDPDEPVQVPPDAPGGLAQVLSRGLDPDPGERYPSAEALRDALEDLEEGSP